MPVSKAKKDSRLMPLIDEVSKTYKIKYHKEHGDTWTSQVIKNELHVGYVKTNTPGGALAHELLHGWVQGCGYNRIAIGISAIDNTDRFRRLLNCLDNELQHHKMYPKFQALGFSPNEFYCDSDANTSSYLHSVLKRTNDELLDVIPDYLTAIAPGGGLTDVEKDDFDKAFRCREGGKHASALSKIHEAVNEWATSANFDVRSVVTPILHQLLNPSYTWIGHTNTDRPPHTGFFVDQEFEVVEPS
jgi:hypothetical protein